MEIDQSLTIACHHCYISVLACKISEFVYIFITRYDATFPDVLIAVCSELGLVEFSVTQVGLSATMLAKCLHLQNNEVQVYCAVDIGGSGRVQYNPFVRDMHEEAVLLLYMMGLS